MATRNKQTKRERKAAKQAAREQARREERRRTLLTIGIVGVVVVLGAALIGLTLAQQRADEAEARRAAEEAASEAQRQAEELANRPVACGASAPEGADEPKPTFEEPEAVLDEGVDYAAVVTTSCGTLEIDLAEDRAPRAVNNFLFLVGEGFYDGLEIFRNATTITALQTGSGTNNAAFQIGYALPDELEFAEAEGYPDGAVAMANSGPDSAGSQFFFVYGDAFALDPTFTRFGTVESGQDVLDRIGEIPTTGPRGETPEELVYLESIEIVERQGSAAPDTDADPDADDEGATPVEPADAATE